MDQGGVDSDEDTIPVHCGEEGVEPEGKMLNLTTGSSWSWHHFGAISGRLSVYLAGSEVKILKGVRATVFCYTSFFKRDTSTELQSWYIYFLLFENSR